MTPREAEEDIIAKALENVHGEKKVAGATKTGMSIVDAFEKFGIM